MTDTTQGQDAPYRLAGPEAMDQWRQGTPMPQPGGGAPALAPQSPFAPPPQPPQPTAGPPPQGHINYPDKPQMGELQQNKEPPPDQKEYQKSAMGWASAFAVLGALSGRFTRAPGGAALAAFGAAVKGWQSGNLQAYQTAADEWEKQSKQALDNNKIVLEKYKASLENYKLNIDEQMQQIQLDSANYHDKIMYDLALSKNYTGVANAYEKGWRQTQKGYEFHAELAADNQEIKAKAEQNGAYWLAPEGQARLAIPEGQPGALTTAQKAGVKQLVDIYGQKQVGKSAIANDRAQFISEFEAREGRKPTSEETTKWEGQRAGETAYGRTAGTQGARVENATNEVKQLLPQAIDASHNLPRGKYVPINELLQMGEKARSNPQYNDFLMANFSLAKAYGRAMNPQGVPRVTEEMEAKAMGILSVANDQKAYDVQARRLWKEVQASKTATAETAEGRSPGDINSPVPGLDTPAGATADADTSKVSDDDLKKKLGL